MSATITTSGIGAADSAPLRRYRSKRRTHRFPKTAAIPPDDPGSSPAPEGRPASTLETIGPRGEVLTFEAWMGGAGLLGDD